MSAAPLLSVIVVCRNPGARLRTALESVWMQRDVQPKPELIVIDGASTDGTPAWLEGERTRIATLLSEPDRGIYDAMNKALAVARGEWVYFLGADDRLANDTVLCEVARELEKTAAGVVAGEATFEDGRVYRFTSTFNPAARNFVHHQAAFYRRALFAQHGRFDPSLRVMADYDHNLRLWQNGVRFEAMPLRIAVCGAGGLSDAGRWLGYREEIAVRHRHVSLSRTLLWDMFSAVRFLRKKTARVLSRQRPPAGRCSATGRLMP
jgi:glycosyltransferase involved in cell wall biosynthesis